MTMGQRQILLLSLLLALAAAMARTADGQQPANVPSENSDTPALSEVAFNGLLARNASWGYVAYLVRSRSLTFTPTQELLQQIDTVGGSRLAEVLKSAKIVPARSESEVDAQLAHGLGQCRAFFYKDDYTAAANECSQAAKIEPASPWPEMGLAEMAVAQKKYDDAIAFAHRAVALAPNMAEAHFSLGEAFALSGNGEGAADELKETLQIDPNHVDALILLGDLYNPSDNSDNQAGQIALSYYRRALALVPDFPDVHERLEAVYEQNNKTAAAIDECSSLEKLEPTDDEWPRKEGKLLVESSDYARAVQAYGQVLVLKPNDADAHYQRGYAMNELKNYSAALEDLREAHRLNPKDDRTLLSLGFALEQQGQYAEALDNFHQTLKLNAKECSAILDIAWILDHEGQDSQALDEYNRAADCAGDNPLELINLGIELTDVGQLEKSAQILEHVVKIAPSNLSGHINLGVALIRLKQYKTAETEFRKAASLDPENVLAHDNLCQVLDNEGEYLDAIEECEKMVQLDPHNFRGWDLLASELENVKNYDALIENARAATSRNPQSAAAWEEFAVLLRSSGQPTQALDAGRRAVALDPQSSVFHFELGQMYASLHDTTHESTEYRSAVSLESADFSDIHALAAALFWKTTDHEDAQKLFQEIQNDGQYRVESLVDLGVIAAENENYNAAIEYENKALAIDPDDASARANVSTYLLDENKVDDAVVQARRAIKSDPELPYAHQALGYALAQQHDWPAAIAEFRQAAKLDPTNIRRQVTLALILNESGDLTAAKNAYLAVLHKQPKDAEQWSSYGSMLMNAHDDSNARDALEKAVTLDSKDSLALNNLAWFYATSFHPEFHDFAKALSLSKLANDLTDWKYAAYIDTYAAALDLAGKHAEAAIAEQEAVHLAPHDSSLQATLTKYQSEAAQAKPIASSLRPDKKPKPKN